MISLLDEQNMNSDNSTPLDSLNGACQFDQVDPSPFSSKKSMYGKDEDGNREDSKHISEEVWMTYTICSVEISKKGYGCKRT